MINYNINKHCLKKQDFEIYKDPIINNENKRLNIEKNEDIIQSTNDLLFLELNLSSRDNENFDQCIFDNNDNDNNDDTININIVIRSKCRPSANYQTKILINEYNKDKIPIKNPISIEEENQIQQERENILSFQNEFPRIFDDEFVNYLIDEEEIDKEFENDFERINESLFMINLFNNYYESNFDGIENNFNHILISSNILIPNILQNLNNESNNGNFFNLQESRYISKQFKKLKIPNNNNNNNKNNNNNNNNNNSSILFQLNDNELNRILNSENTINIGVFNCINFRDNRFVMFV
ncbi:hypothetical protein C6P42_000871 [Pichia californica]|nr:hypothetical protein C6P42_000871 [[Candida] californica]